MTGLLCCVVSKSSWPPPGALEALARACSPRVMTCGRTAAVFDASGLARAIGSPREIVKTVRRQAASEGLLVRVVVAGTMSSAWLLAHASTAATVVEPGGEAAALAPLPLVMLKTLPAGTDPAATDRDVAGALVIFKRWGLLTLGDVARLPRADVRTRLGAVGVRLHEAACGEDDVPLVPHEAPGVFLERIELEWPIEELEPLAFVLARASEALSVRLERADRGAVSITTRLMLVTRDTHTRTLELPAPMRDARVLRTLVLLDLESHPPAAGIDALELELGVTAGRITQGLLLEHTVPSPEALATLLARLGALAGESRVGSPAIVDAHDERAVGLTPFCVSRRAEPRPCDASAPRLCRTAIRRFRGPVPARVAVERGAPVRMEPARGMPGGRIVSAAGPWRTSGQWWSLDGAGWDRDGWDVQIEAGPGYRLARNRTDGRWEIEGILD